MEFVSEDLVTLNVTLVFLDDWDMAVMDYDVRTRTYGIEINQKEVQAAFWGTLAMRKYIENGRIVISWAGWFQPVDFLRSSMSGLTFRHKDWIDITPSRLNPGEAYQIEPEVETSPDEMISALMDLVINTVDLNLDASHQLIENLLLQGAMKERK
uniref:Uncharacterized protein n=1 Tax=Globisporangium ultimum (strain ATCC 200006 / CBS 805.95 / DAOM BR144) TaxID=431595 RepID=K3W8X1_GLOUD